MDKNKREEALNKAVEDTRKKLKLPRVKADKKVQWMGESYSRKAIQKDLNEMLPAEKVVYLTADYRDKVYDQLDHLSEEERDEDAIAYFKEHEEMIDYDNADDHEDWDESYWMSGFWLKKLAKHKKTLRYWKAYRNE